MAIDSDQLVKELRGTLAKMELALGAIGDSVVWTSEDGKIQWCNSAFDQLVACAHIDVLGSNLIHLLVLEEYGLPLAPKSHPVSLALHEPFETRCTYEYRRGDQKKVLEIIGKQIQLTPHETNLVFSIRDITERRISEEKDKQFANYALASAEMEHKRALELDKAYQQLKETQGMLVQSEKMAAVGQLAAGVAHEVKNPLGIILQSVNFLELELGSGKGELVEILQTLKEAVKRADRIISTLLDFSRPAPLERKAVEIGKTIETSLHLLAKQLRMEGVKVTQEIPESLPPVLADENEMQQVFINLFLNAVQAMPKGGKLSVRCRSQVLTQPGKGVGKRATDKLRVGETVLICEIEDTGVGIAAEHLPKIFDPFFTTKPLGQGTGLGLAVTRSIVENQGGMITADSEAGRGTQITVTFPIVTS